MIPEIEGNRTNILIARSLNKLRVTHMDNHVYYDGYDYEHDLDAMHMAEMTLKTRAELDKYEDILCRMYMETLPPEKRGILDAFYFIAPAEMRAAAFLEAVNA